MLAAAFSSPSALICSFSLFGSRNAVGARAAARCRLVLGMFAGRELLRNCEVFGL